MMTKKDCSLNSRREFLRRTGTAILFNPLASPATLFAAETTPGSKFKALIGSNIYGWTQYYARDKKPLNVNEILSALRDAGYDYLENFMDSARPESIAQYAGQLRAKGMTPVSLYSGARLHDAKAGETVQRLLAAAKVCKEAGFAVISCNPDPIGREKTEDELKNQVAALTDLGQGMKEMGLQLGIHHHLPEMANKAREFHYVFRNTDPQQVGFCYDVHWVWKGGIAPMDALKEYGNRVVTWHLRQSREGVWWEDLDTGDVDYAAVARYAREHQMVARYTVELALEGKTKITRSAVENHRRSAEFVRKVFGMA